MATKKRKRSTLKSSVKRRTLNQTTGGTQRARMGTPGQEQDVERRLGNFTGKGEHARVGGRTSGIVGQTSKDFGTDNKRTKSTKPRTKHGPGSR
jgi:hypothetical protein